VGRRYQSVCSFLQMMFVSSLTLSNTAETGLEDNAALKDQVYSVSTMAIEQSSDETAASTSSPAPAAQLLPEFQIGVSLYLCDDALL
jgi:hypothetical protein